MFGGDGMEGFDGAPGNSKCRTDDRPDSLDSDDSLGKVYRRCRDCWSTFEDLLRGCPSCR